MNPNEETPAESQARVETAPDIQEPAGDAASETQDNLDAPQEGPAG